MLIVFEGACLHTARAEELSELEEVQRSDVQDVEAHSEQLLLGCCASACLQASELVAPIEDLRQLGLREVPKHLAD